MSYGSNRYGKDNPRSTIGNAAKASVERGRNACGNCVARLIGLLRRAGRRLHARNDAESRWQHWQVTEYRGGLVRQYRDARFEPMQREKLSATPPTGGR